MKRIFILLSLLSIAVMMFGCGKTENNTYTGNDFTLQNIDKTGTLQGKIMDATTGAALSLSASGDQILLIQGTVNRGPDKLNTDPNDPLVGEYAFSGIPVNAGSNNTTFKVVVIKEGYQRFEANVVMPALVHGVNMIDNVINMIGNIYLFPIGAVPGDVTITVLSDHGLPVPGVTVLLQQSVSSNVETAIAGNRLSPAAGLYTSLTATTDANGVATFSGSRLVLGGDYNAVAQAINFNGDQLGTTASGLFTVGIDSSVQTINMFGITTFFATTASNQLPNSVSANGLLTITFNEPIALTANGFVASGLASDGTTTTETVQAVLSNNNLTATLSLSPTSAITGTTANIPGSVVTYTPVNGANDQPFILQQSQTNSGFTFGPFTNNPLNLNGDPARPVSNVVRQIAF